MKPSLQIITPPENTIRFLPEILKPSKGHLFRAFNGLGRIVSSTDGLLTNADMMEGNFPRSPHHKCIILTAVTAQQRRCIIAVKKIGSFAIYPEPTSMLWLKESGARKIIGLPNMM